MTPLIVLFSSLFVIGVGLFVLAFRHRIQANLPFVENPSTKDLHSGAPSRVTLTSIAILVVGFVGVLIFVIVIPH